MRKDSPGGVDRGAIVCGLGCSGSLYSYEPLASRGGIFLHHAYACLSCPSATNCQAVPLKDQGLPRPQKLLSCWGQVNRYSVLVHYLLAPTLADLNILFSYYAVKLRE